MSNMEAFLLSLIPLACSIFGGWYIIFVNGNRWSKNMLYAVMFLWCQSFTLSVIGGCGYIVFWLSLGLDLDFSFIVVYRFILTTFATTNIFFLLFGLHPAFRKKLRGQREIRD